jgi:hypothetical protein
VGNFTATGTTNGTSTLTVTSGTNTANGQLISSSTGDVPAGTTIVSGGGTTTLTMSNAATGSNAGETISFQGATYFVVSTGLSGSQFEVATTQGGTPIVAGSAGSGTQTAKVMNLLTVCQGPTLLGYLTGTAYTTAATPNVVWIGFSGEEPAVAGPTYYWYGWAIDLTGKFSTTSCIL